MKPRESGFFWTSYTDLMTSLFFVMLTLYVLTVAVLRYRQRATEEQLRKITEIQNATRNLDSTLFLYQPDYKRFVLRRQIQFPAGSAVIPVADAGYLQTVGRSLKTLIETLGRRYRGQNIKYLVVIEGMASKDRYPLNDELSYARALALHRFWIRQHLRPDPAVCEVIVAGSGTEGAGRDAIESRNQRILIQIIPKIGTIN
jgi:hypothetical protein